MGAYFGFLPLSGRNLPSPRSFRVGDALIRLLVRNDQAAAVVGLGEVPGIEVNLHFGFELNQQGRNTNECVTEGIQIGGAPA